MNKLQKLNRELERETRDFESFKARNHADKVAVIGRRVIGCPSCHAACRIKNWGFVQDYWYTRPHGCNEGDYWTQSETKVCHLICPHCGEQIYIYNHYHRDLIVDLVDNQGLSKKEIFATIWEKHGDNPLKKVFPTP